MYVCMYVHGLPIVKLSEGSVCMYERIDVLDIWHTWIVHKVRTTYLRTNMCTKYVYKVCLDYVANLQKKFEFLVTGLLMATVNIFL